jgi:hypothetical protein
MHIHIHIHIHTTHQAQAEIDHLIPIHEHITSQITIAKRHTQETKLREACHTGDLNMVRKLIYADKVAADCSVPAVLYTEGKGFVESASQFVGCSLGHYCVMPCLGWEKHSKLQCCEFVYYYCYVCVCVCVCVCVHTHIYLWPRKTLQAVIS